MNDRNRHINKEVHCSICNDTNQIEDISHFMLHCSGYIEERKVFGDLQQPYIEDEDTIIGRLLFEKRNIEKKKEYLHSIWNRKKTPITIKGID